MQQQNKLDVRHKTIGMAVAAALQIMMIGGISEASAACTPDPAVSGDNIICTGTDADGLKIAAGIDNLNITINSGAVLQANTSANPSVSLQVNAGNTIVNNGRIENLGGSQVNDYLVNLNGANNTFTNNGEIFMGVSVADITGTAAKNTRTLRGFYTSASSGSFDNINIINSGSIVLEHAGIGNAQGFYPGEEIDGLAIDNSGTIGVHRTSALTITVSGGNVFGNSLIAGTTAGALGVAAAIGSDDDAEMSVINRAGGVIEATGTYASAIFARAIELEIQNSGIIRSDAIAISAHGGLADGTHGELEIGNLAGGEIIGDILAVDANALRYWGQEAKGLTGLTLNNQAGIRNSEIENEGTITGNIYLGSGSHEIENEGTITGNILVDQNTIGTPPGDPAARMFTLENEGTLRGNITIRDVAASVNDITLEGDGFDGNIVAVNGVGANTLNLQGSGTLRGDVTKFTTLNVGEESGAPVDDDDDDAGSSGWILAAGKTFEFTDEANLNSGLLTVLGNLKANTNVNEGATLGGTGTITGNLVNNGTVDVAAGILQVNGNASFNDDSIFKTTITSSANGLLAVTGMASFDDDAILKPIVQNTLVKNGDTYTVLTSTGLTGTPQLQGTALIGWNVSSDPDNLIITANVQGASAAGVTGTSGKVLDALLGFDSELGIQIQNLGTAEEVRKVGKQLLPETNGASMQAVLNVTDKVQGLVESHLDDTHLASINGKSGIATGNQPLGTGIWLQGFGFRGDQDKLDGVDGYTADAYGFAAGIDTLLKGDRIRIGVAASYAQSSVDDSGERNGQADIDSYQATLYASWLLDGWYLNGSIGLGQHQFDNEKTILGNSVSGDHDAWQYSARIDAGWPFKIGSATLVPVASLAYTRFNQDSYTENGVGAQHVSPDDADSLRSGLGAKAFLPVEEGNVNVTLELRAIWNHEFADRSLDTTANFVGGGAAFTTQGLDLPRDSANLGASLKITGISEAIQQSLQVSYDAEIRDQYLSHAGRIQARFDF